ncbi:hypothetical protein HMPREF0294_1618 [Corynebacterium glucuronolyticum ATCC 51867]|nr:hypothetical protein HMPREF0294_1618 [Corynebacterium glucuronolyticum ATCC 51867]
MIPRLARSGNGDNADYPLSNPEMFEKAPSGTWEGSAADDPSPKTDQLRM